MVEYWRGRLPANAQRIYDRLVAAFERGSFSVECDVSDAKYLSEIYFAVFIDHPEMFYLSHAPRVSQRRSAIGGMTMSVKSTVTITPVFEPNQIRDFEQQIDGIVSDLQRGITAATTDEEKVIMAVECVVKRTEYAIDHTFNQNAAAALCLGRAQCSGIARAVKLLLDRLGVFCIVLNGEAEDGRGGNGPHSWNVVQIDGKYYHVDPTFMLGANKSKRLPLRRMYLFYDDDRCAADHKWDRGTVPACTDGSRAMDGSAAQGAAQSTARDAVQNIFRGFTQSAQRRDTESAPRQTGQRTGQGGEKGAGGSDTVIGSPWWRGLFGRPAASTERQSTARWGGARENGAGQSDARQNANQNAAGRNAAGWRASQKSTENRTVAQNGAAKQPPRSSAYPCYHSLGELRGEIDKMFKGRERERSFYLDINLKTQSELLGAVKNAYTMAAKRAAVGYSSTVSVTSELLITIKIDF